MIVRDTTVLVYAVGAHHPLCDPCRDLIGAVAAGRLWATTTVEVLQELTHVRARRRDREDSARLAGDDLDLLAPLLVVGEDDLQEGCASMRAATAFAPSTPSWLQPPAERTPRSSPPTQRSPKPASTT